MCIAFPLLSRISLHDVFIQRRHQAELLSGPFREVVLRESVDASLVRHGPREQRHCRKVPTQTRADGVCHHRGVVDFRPEEKLFVLDYRAQGRGGNVCHTGQAGTGAVGGVEELRPVVLCRVHLAWGEEGVLAAHGGSGTEWRGGWEGGQEIVDAPGAGGLTDYGDF